MQKWRLIFAGTALVLEVLAPQGERSRLKRSSDGVVSTDVDRLRHFCYSSSMDYPVVLRVTKLETLGNVAASGQHTWRERFTKNASPERRHLNQDWRDVSSSMALVEAVKRRVVLSDEKTEQKRVPCLEYLVSANALAFKEHGGLVEFEPYFKDALAWIEGMHGAENVVAINVQLDELTPHLVVYVVPLIEESSKKVRRSVIVGKNEDGSQKREVREVDKPGKRRLSAATFVDGREKLSQMQTDFAELVGKRHGLARGLEGSTAFHETTKAWHARKNQSASMVPKLPQLEVPEPTISERFSPRDYKERVAHSVREQLSPFVRAMTGLADDARMARRDEAAAKKQANASQERAQEAETAAMHVKSQLVKAEELLALFTDDQLEEAQLRRQEALAVAENARKLQLARDTERQRQLKMAQERQRRIDVLPQLLRTAVGAALTFAQRAVDALKAMAGRDREVDWIQVEAQTIGEAIGRNGQDPAVVAKDVCEVSPVRVDPASHALVYEQVAAVAPTLQAAYAQDRGHGQGHGVDPK